MADSFAQAIINNIHPGIYSKEIPLSEEYYNLIRGRWPLNQEQRQRDIQQLEKTLSMLPEGIPSGPQMSNEEWSNMMRQKSASIPPRQTLMPAGTFGEQLVPQYGSGGMGFWAGSIPKTPQMLKEYMAPLAQKEPFTSAQIMEHRQLLQDLLGGKGLETFTTGTMAREKELEKERLAQAGKEKIAEIGATGRIEQERIKALGKADTSKDYQGIYDNMKQTLGGKITSVRDVGTWLMEPIQVPDKMGMMRSVTRRDALNLTDKTIRKLYDMANQELSQGGIPVAQPAQQPLVTTESGLTPDQINKIQQSGATNFEQFKAMLGKPMKPEMEMKVRKYFEGLGKR